MRRTTRPQKTLTQTASAALSRDDAVMMIDDFAAPGVEAGLQRFAPPAVGWEDDEDEDEEVLDDDEDLDLGDDEDEDFFDDDEDLDEDEEELDEE